MKSRGRAVNITLAGGQRLRVCIAPDLMPQFFKGGYGSTRERLEQYLNRSHPPTEADRRNQCLVDQLIQELLDGKDARVVFRLKPMARQNTRRGPQWGMAMAAEVLRLTQNVHTDVTEVQAKKAVAEAFGDATVRTVERHLREYRRDLLRRPNFFVNYTRNLQHRKLLP